MKYIFSYITMFKHLLLLLGFLAIGIVLPVKAATACQADINQDTLVDLSDYSILVANFFKSPPDNIRADITGDGVVDISDYSTLTSFFLQNCTSSSSLPAETSEWTQFAANSTRTSYVAGVATPWRYAWQWNSADSKGKVQSNHLSVPRMVQPITGGGRVYMVAGNGLYALGKQSGSVLWSKSGIGSLSATPAYLSEYVYLPSNDGNLYKLNAVNGSLVGTFNAGSALTQAPLIVNNTIYIGSSGGKLFAVSADSMTKQWEYTTGSPVVTAAAYSPTRGIIIVNSQDLNVHAIRSSNGTQLWKVKPTDRVYQSGNPTKTGAQFEEGWPVIAEKRGVVFVRYRVDWDSLWTWSPYPTTNSEIVANLTNNPNQQVLFALNIGTGQKEFIPAVGNGGAGDGGNLPMGTQPIIKEINGKEVAYIIWRNGLTCASTSWCDGRDDAAMGEMVLDSTTVSGYKAGEVRFVQFLDIQTDEMMNISMGGDVIFHSHWLINAAKKITDRSVSLGGTYSNAIKTVDAPNLIWRQCYCPSTNPQCNPILYPGGSGYTSCPVNCPFNASSRYCSGGLFSYGDQRGYPAGFYQYHNDRGVDNSVPFTVISDGMVLIKARDGGLIALTSGSPTALEENPDSSSQAVAGAIATPAQPIDYTEASKYIGQVVQVSGVIQSVVNRRPKAMYIGFRNPHDGALLLRVFERDMGKFQNFDFERLKGKKVFVTGFISLYWPDGQDPEIIITDPAQIKLM